MCVKMPGRRASAGFTLIELLVVVAIIALLIAILLPSLNNARERSKEVTCGANLRSVAMAALLYTQDFTGFLPPVIGEPTKTVASNPRPSRWKHSGNFTTPPSDSSYWMGDFLVEAGFVNFKNFDCPTNDGAGIIYDTSTSPWTPAGTVSPGVEFGMSGFYDQWGGAPNNTFFAMTMPTSFTWPGASTLAQRQLAFAQQPLRFSRMNYPMRGMLFADVAPGGRSPFIYPNGSRMMHGNQTRGNVSFMDGRVESMQAKEFWPNLRTAPDNAWTRSAMWRPIDESGVSKTW